MDKQITINRKTFKDGSSTYFVSLKIATNGKNFLKISNVRKNTDGTNTKSSVVIFEEKILEFIDILNDVLTTSSDEPNNLYNFDKIREKYPNAYLPWKKEDDKILLDLNAKGNTIEKISTILGRSYSSIESRLRKLNE